uniref:Uncharacterized protein LOC104235707 isoform X3 n=1 Tax=Nicotiana sylvestris TaxID=4096 RepID=A0A1U7X6U6_NICSY|nr:PREDICTED: uncharacterized protein LOC104235707 isoform X3 [Nicotiana sylvestris]
MGYSFSGVPTEESLHWRSFLVRLGAENLKGVKNEELLVACHKSVFVVYTILGGVSIYVVGKEEYDELVCLPLEPSFTWSLPRSTCQLSRFSMWYPLHQNIYDSRSPKLASFVSLYVSKPVRGSKPSSMTLLCRRTRPSNLGSDISC